MISESISDIQYRQKYIFLITTCRPFSRTFQKSQTPQYLTEISMIIDKKTRKQYKFRGPFIFWTWGSLVPKKYTLSVIYALMYLKVIFSSPYDICVVVLYAAHFIDDLSQWCARRLTNCTAQARSTFFDLATLLKLSSFILFI